MPVGFCGLGAMGSAIAERLLAQGHRLTVWNRTAGRAVTRSASQVTTPPIMFNFAHLEQDRFGWNHFASSPTWRPKREFCSTS